jgi:prolyl-tRNA editing enzyme YbaK/EbsC (Cys-tRNA(Pro) deacylase)
MEDVLSHSSVIRVRAVLDRLKIGGEVLALQESARTAAEAAEALGIEVGQVASSIVFKLPDGSPLLVITSGRHRVDTELVARGLGVLKLGTVDATYVKEQSGFAIGGVSPVGWVNPATVVIDKALADYEVVWAAAGHPHSVFPTTYAELLKATNALAMIVGE